MPTITNIMEQLKKVKNREERKQVTDGYMLGLLVEIRDELTKINKKINIRKEVKHEKSN